MAQASAKIVPRMDLLEEFDCLSQCTFCSRSYPIDMVIRDISGEHYCSEQCMEECHIEAEEEYRSERSMI